MRRRLLLLAPGAPLVAGLWPHSGFAQSAPRPTIIGRLHPGSASDPTQQTYLQGFSEGMRALGHVEGRDYRIEARFAEGDPTRLATVAAELVGLKVDLILASSDSAVRAAMEATQSIPIVMAMSGPDPVGAGLIANLARPGSNVTGFTGQTDELQVKQLELLREVVPHLSDILLLFNSQQSTRPNGVLAGGAATLRLRLHHAPLAQPDDLAPALARAVPPGAWAIIAAPDPAIIDRIRRPIAEQALKHRLPSAGSFRASAAAGGLLSFGIDLVNMHRSSARVVDKILKGARPAQLPVERPTKFELVVNLATARALGLTIPPAILARADEVIE
jgi:putative ABC transport system substrate-binding protein